MPVLGKTTNYPDASDIVVVFVNGVIRYTMPVAYIFHVTRELGGAEVDIVQGASSHPQWGQG